MRRLILGLFLIIGCFNQLVLGQSVNHWETAVFNNDTWRYFVGTGEPDPDWKYSTFDETAWLQGTGGFGYGDSDDNTVIPQCISVYLRTKFNVADTSKILSAILSMDYDDAFIAYLNGHEIARVGLAPVNPLFSDTGDDHEATMYQGGSPETFLIDKENLKYSLLNGENVLAVEVHNSSLTSSDLSSNAFLFFGINDASYDYRTIPSWFIPPFTFTSSKLPVVIITTNSGETIRDEPKITADMKIIYNSNGAPNYSSDPGNIYSGKVGIEIRGRYSASLPQKPYGFETRDTLGNNLNVSLLGMPAENDWILQSNYNDKVFLRNFLAFNLWEKMGHYATRTRYCEVVVNNDYQGIYLLGEKIKRDSNRVDIAKLKPDDNDGNELTGGYIFKTDYYTAEDSWLSNFSPINKPGAEIFFVYYDPRPEELSNQQKSYLRDYVNSFETVLYGPEFNNRQSGYRAYLDVNSFVDYFIIGEISRNVDAYKKSRYFYKDKDSNGGLIVSGPVWDFDWAFKNISENCIQFNQTNGSGWAYRINECEAWPVPPSWEVKLMQDDDFRNRIHDKYSLLRSTILSETQINHTIDSISSLLNEAQERHYQKWKILGINVGTPESDYQPATFEGETDKFKSWIKTRLLWLDANIVGRPYRPGEGYKAICRVFPNPVSDNLYVESDTIMKRITFYNYMGSPVKEVNYINDYTSVINLSHLSAGLFLLRIEFSHGEAIIRRIVKK